MHFTDNAYETLSFLEYTYFQICIHSKNDLSMWLEATLKLPRALLKSMIVDIINGKDTGDA